MTADEEHRRQVLATAAAGLTAEVGELNDRLDLSNKQLAALADRNRALGERSKKHSGWIFATAAGLLLDVILTIVLFDANAQQRATDERLERSIQESCAFYALVIGSYRPESRPPGPDREQYDRNFVRMRQSYDVLECTEPLVPPATPR